MKHIRNLGNQIKISLPLDKAGYLGRECPEAHCKGYFKIVIGTGLKGVTSCHCPYCGHTGEQREFHTHDQVKYAKSVVMRKITDAFVKDLKSMEFESKPRGLFGIGVSMKVKPGERRPIQLYREQALETHIECVGCTLKYAVFGVFAFCPDCRQHNSVQIMDKNLELVLKMLGMASSVDAELAERLVENALEDCVSAFDGFGREICRVNAAKSSDVSKAIHVSFQNLDGANQNLHGLFGFDLTAGASPCEWQSAIRAFQKRHVLSHKMGVIDDEYARKSGDTQAVVGRKISVTAPEVNEVVATIGKLARHVSDELSKLGRIP